MNDLEIAKREIRKAQDRARKKRDYALNRTAILEDKRRKRAKASKRPLVLPQGEFYDTPRLAKLLGKDEATVRRWRRNGIIPQGRYIHNREHLYTPDEAQILVSGFKLLGRTFGPGGFNRRIMVDGRLIPFKQWVKDGIMALRQKGR